MAENLFKKGWKVQKLEKRQPIFFKYKFWKKSQDCNEILQDHYMSLKITSVHDDLGGLSWDLAISLCFRFNFTLVHGFVL